MKIRISHFGSSACLWLLAFFFLSTPPLAVQLLQSDQTKQNVEDVIPLIYICCYIVGAFLLCSAFSEAKYYILNNQGISLHIFGVTYRKIKWENIYDVVIGQDPLRKYTAQTLLLNCQPKKKYRPRKKLSIDFSVYENAFYKDLFRGKIICLRCGKKLDTVLMLLSKCFLGNIERLS